MPISVTSERKRKEWIDVLRALAMLFVIYGHLLAGYHHQNYYAVTSPVKIPLFFAITGYVFNPRNGNVKVFLKNLLTKLIIPLLLFTVVLMPFKIFAASKGLINHSEKEVFISFVTGNELWYLPCCIVAECLFFFVLKFFKRERSIVLCCLCLATAGLVLGHFDILSTANVNTALTAQFFILLGYLFSRHEKWFHQNERIILPVGLLCYCVLCVISRYAFPREYLDVHRNYYYSIPLNFSQILIGNLTLFTAASFASVKCGPLEYVGRNTITYYVTHEYVVGVIGTLMERTDLYRGTYLCELVIMIAVCVVCAAISYVINRYVPFAVGKKRRTG